MKIEPPRVERRKDGWYIIILNLLCRHTFGPFKKCPKAKMEVWGMENLSLNRN